MYHCNHPVFHHRAEQNHPLLAHQCVAQSQSSFIYLRCIHIHFNAIVRLMSSGWPFASRCSYWPNLFLIFCILIWTDVVIHVLYLGHRGDLYVQSRGWSMKTFMIWLRETNTCYVFRHDIATQKGPAHGLRIVSFLVHNTSINISIISLIALLCRLQQSPMFLKLYFARCTLRTWPWGILIWEKLYGSQKKFN